MEKSICKEVLDLVAIPVENRRRAYWEMRRDLEIDWYQVCPSALRNRYQVANNRAQAGGYRATIAEQMVEDIANDVSSYERKRHLKHLMAVLAGNKDSILKRENFEYTTRYMGQPYADQWNREADYIAAIRISELKKEGIL